MIGYYNLSLIGTSHKQKNICCQDANSVCFLENGWLVATIADGLGSAKKSDIGANTAVETIINFISKNHPYEWKKEELKSCLMTAYIQANKTINIVAAENGDNPSDYATTSTTAIYNGKNLAFMHVGDGGIISISSSGDYSVLTTAQKGMAFNETYPLSAGSDFWTFGSANDVCAFLMMTDGIFDRVSLPLLKNKNPPIDINYARKFMDINRLKLTTKIDITSQEDFQKIQKIIESYFSGEYCSITDDKTIVGVINIDVIPEKKPDEYYAEPDWEGLRKQVNDALYGKNEVLQNSEIKNDNNPSTQNDVVEKHNAIEDSVVEHNSEEPSTICTNKEVKKKSCKVLQTIKLKNKEKKGNLKKNKSLLGIVFTVEVITILIMVGVILFFQ